MKSDEGISRRGVLAGIAGIAGVQLQRTDRPAIKLPESRIQVPIPGPGFLVTGAGRSEFFTEAAGLGTEHEVVEVRSAGDPTPRKVPGRFRVRDITFRRALTGNRAAWIWREQVATDIAGARSNGKIEYFDNARVRVAEWSFRNGWPSGIAVVTEASKPLLEELRLTHEGLVRTL